MNNLIESQFKRAEELLNDLESEYGKALKEQTVTPRAINLTHEVLSKIRSILDHVMHQYFEKKIAPNLTDDEKKKIVVYFPIVDSDQSLKSTLGRGKMADIDQTDQKVYHFLRSVQPYTNSSNKWLELLNQYAVEGKHIRLVPQKKMQQKRLTIRSEGASVSIGEGASIKIGKGASIRIGGKQIMGGQVLGTNSDVIYGDPTLDVKKEIWISFNFENTNINALGLCKESLQKSKDLINQFNKLF